MRCSLVFCSIACAYSYGTENTGITESSYESTTETMADTVIEDLQGSLSSSVGNGFGSGGSPGSGSSYVPAPTPSPPTPSPPTPSPPTPAPPTPVPTPEEHRSKGSSLSTAGIIGLAIGVPFAALLVQHGSAVFMGGSSVSQVGLESGGAFQLVERQVPRSNFNLR